MSIPIIIIICLIILVLIQAFLSKQDNILMGLLIPAVFLMVSIIMALSVKSGAIEKINIFMQWFSPGIVAIAIYAYIKKKKYNIRKQESEAYRNQKTTKDSIDKNNIIEIEAEVIDEQEIKNTRN
ncbi:hypothetical protein [Anaerofustis sp.]|uniref:hypothetical protein n=1 Tax=Anaerofustis sp. TaxID=1872517 RepID=UPI0025BC9706|nr:hypothetical protein [Anaerofustis sp.]